MTYEEGIAHMQSLVETHKNGYFSVGTLLVTYPGYKKPGDYKLTENGVAPKHTDIIDKIHSHTTSQNFAIVASFLEDVYINGAKASANIIEPNFKEKIFWITLQEEINYPQSKGFSGRKMPFQRYYEAALIHKALISLGEVKSRTNNHGRERPALILTGIPNPVFYL